METFPSAAEERTGSAMYQFIVPGAPRGKQRPKVTRNGAYTPEETKRYEQKVLVCFLQEYPRMKPIRNGVNVHITAFFEIPKSYGKERRERILNGLERPTKKPDADNIAKIILDALNGKVILDDKQVVRLTVSKYYSTIPRVEVLIEEW